MDLGVDAPGTDAELAAAAVTPPHVHGDWNYTVYPGLNRASYNHVIWRRVLTQ
jgi:hypothetical protein